MGVVTLSRRSLVVGATAVSAHLALSACTPKSLVGETTIALPWIHSSEFAFLYEAIDEKRFGDVKVDLSSVMGSHLVVQELDQKRAMFGLIAADTLIAARANEGFPFRALAVLYHSSPAVIVSLAAKNIIAPRDLVGKRVGVVTTSTVREQFYALLKREAIDRDSIIEVPAVRGGAQQLLDGDIDALTQFTNFAPVTFRATGHEVNEIAFSKYGIDLYGTCLATSDDIIERNADLCQIIVSGVVSGLRDTVNNPEKAFQSVAKPGREKQLNPKESRDRLTRTVALFADSVGGDSYGEMNLEGWMKSQETLRETGQVKTPIDPKYFFDDKFINTALK